jgi:succinate dehydrogenase / fumarate reductase cytochrome b subunit
MFISSILKKYLMSFTGLLMTLFSFVHMIGNVQFFKGKSVINNYGIFLKTQPIFIILTFRILMLVLITIHIFFAFLITIQNYRLRPIKYLKFSEVENRFSSRNMMKSGLLTLLFIIFHLLHFTLKKILPNNGLYSFLLLNNGLKHLNIYQSIIYSFSTFWITLIYLIAMISLYFHLDHGIGSSFQTLGLINFRSRSFVKIMSKILSLTICIGLGLIPLLNYLNKFINLI